MQENIIEISNLTKKFKDFTEFLIQFFKKVIEDTAKAKLLRAIESPRQLQEVMTEFWFNHFNRLL